MRWWIAWIGVGLLLANYGYHRIREAQRGVRLVPVPESSIFLELSRECQVYVDGQKAEQVEGFTEWDGTWHWCK